MILCCVDEDIDIVRAKEEIVKFRVATVVIASAGILLAATACSSGGSSNGGASAPAKTTAAAAKTYTASDLPTILTTAEKKVGLSGKILDNAQVQASEKQAQTSGGVQALLSQKGVTITPASCATILKNNLSQTPPADSVNAGLTYGSNLVLLSTISGKKLPTTYTTGAAAQSDKALSECGSMKISLTESGQTVSIPLTLKKISVSTDADQTRAIEETITVPSATGGAGKPVSVEIISAIAGNLAITAEGSSTATTAASTPSASPTVPLTDVINAVVAAAK
ncbi:hypothetical protein AX769_08970 [Frondihabitans sp. PAMC 28766]|nr:hypothetical protein AX769_08970 [Frondihabitans sp. PAMC 28766]